MRKATGRQRAVSAGGSSRENGSAQATIQSNAELYNLRQWAGGYFDISSDGELTVKPRGAGNAPVAVGLRNIVEQCIERGATLPLLLRFPDIVKHRIGQQHACFREAMCKYGYRGSYLCAFPIKANHAEDTIMSVVSMKDESVPCGLEVGSKPELVIALALSSRCKDVPIVCNGFKDAKYVDLALRAHKAGANIVLSIDRFEELETILLCSERVETFPMLGVRAKLNTRHSGHWGSSSGFGSKFGLKAGQLIRVAEVLQQHGRIGALKMLHFHLGSQVEQISALKSAMREACAIFSELHRMGAPLDTIDVGGGLAITYDGEEGSCQPEYTLQNYANDIVAAINDMCVQKEIPAPTIVTESGRSISSHHSLVVFDSHNAATEHCPLEQKDQDLLPEVHDANSRMAYFFKTFSEVLNGFSESGVEEAYNDALQFKHESENAFALGLMTLEEMAQAEDLFDRVMFRVAQSEDYRSRKVVAASHAFRATQDSQAVKCLANVSLFRSAIDSWAIGQPFPLMPISGLDRKANNIAAIYDLTCDSDGEIKRFVTSKGQLSPVFPMRCENKDMPLLALFLTGAYQESMGSCHNLFGKNCTVTIVLKPDQSGVEIARMQPAETVSEILEKANYCPEALRSELAGIQGTDALSSLMRAFDNMLRESPYLENSKVH